MTMDELIVAVARTLETYGYSFYTSSKMRSNPDVCYSACTWFLNNLSKHGILDALTLLDSTDKETLKITQQQCENGTKQPSAVVQMLRSSNKPLSDDDIDAINAMIAHWERPPPSSYITNVQDLVNIQIKNAVLKTAVKQFMIYILPDVGSTGHTICMAIDGGGLIIYDPNMGVMAIPLNKPDVWSGTLVMILQWYAREMKLTKAAIKGF